jgi:hypothetical protein
MAAIRRSKNQAFQIFPETFHLGIPCEPQKLAESMSPLGLAAVHDLERHAAFDPINS